MLKLINHSALIFCLLSSLASNAQYTFSHHEDIAKVKNGTTLVVVNDTTGATVMQYKKIFKKYWTQSKFKFVLESDLGNYNLNKNATLGITTDGYLLSSDNSSHKLHGGYFQLQIGDDVLAEIYLLIDDGKGKVKPFNDSLPQYNWGPGILKNYIQSIMTYFVTSTEKKLSENVAVTSRLQELRTRVLYIPDYMLMKYPIIGDGTIREAGKVLGKYPYPYKVVTPSELNKMILDSTNGIYYALYNPDIRVARTLSVINSSTGFVIYSDFPSVQVPELHEGDIKKLVKQIDTK